MIGFSEMFNKSFKNIAEMFHDSPNIAVQYFKNISEIFQEIFPRELSEIFLEIFRRRFCRGHSHLLEIFHEIFPEYFNKTFPKTFWS